jgi:hypothetical protein
MIDLLLSSSMFINQLLTMGLPAIDDSLMRLLTAMETFPKSAILGSAISFAKMLGLLLALLHGLLRVLDDDARPPWHGRDEARPYHRPFPVYHLQQLHLRVAQDARKGTGGGDPSDGTEQEQGSGGTGAQGRPKAGRLPQTPPAGAGQHRDRQAGAGNR